MDRIARYKSMRRKHREKERRGPSSYEPPELPLARARWLEGRYAESLDLFRRAVQRSPRNANTLADAARAFGARFEFAQAEEYVDQLERLGKQDPTVLELVGQTCRMIRRPQMAMNVFERAISLPGASPTVRLELAMLYERRHRLAEAAEQIDTWLATQPHSREGQLLAGRLARRRGEFSAAIDQLWCVAKDVKAHSITRAQALHELALVHDQQQNYADAVAALAAAKKALKPLAAEHRAQADRENAEIESLFSSLTRDHLNRWVEASEDESGQVWLTGLPRSGTTLLERVLNAHPNTITSDELELFPKFIFPSMLDKRDGAPLTAADFDAICPDRLCEQRARYLAGMQQAGEVTFGGRLHVDKNPSIIALIPGMLRLFGRSKLLIALRDPRDVVLSCYMRYLPLNAVSVQFLTIRGAAARFARDIRLWQRLKELLPDNWLEVRYEDMVHDLDGESRRVTGFLGQEWDQRMLAFHQDTTSRAVNSPTYEAVNRPLYTSAIGRWRAYEDLLAPELDRLKPVCSELGYT